LPRNNFILETSKVTFGIYLVHPIFLFFLRHIGIHSEALPVLGFIISAICIYTALKIIPTYISKYLF